MRYRRFGKTNLHLSIFSLGTMRCLASEGQYRETVIQGIKSGINHIETARGYGKSEIYLGKTIQADIPIPREKLYITTKLPPTSSQEQMHDWIEDSLKRLKVDYLDCLAIHGLNTWSHLDWLTEGKSCLPAINAAIAAGKIKHLGFSTHGSRELIQRAIATQLFSFVNLHYYYFFQHHQPIIELAAKEDLGILIISPVDKGGRLHQPSSTLVELCKPKTPLELNYRFLLSNPKITTLSLGAANPQEVQIPLADQDHPLTPTEKAIFQALEVHQQKSLGRDRCSQCYQCLPCPEEINIPEILRLRNLAVAYDLTEYGKYRYGMLEKAGHWFPGRQGNRCTDCGDCLPRCPEKLNIPELLRDSHRRLSGRSRRRLWEE